MLVVVWFDDVVVVWWDGVVVVWLDGIVLCVLGVVWWNGWCFYGGEIGLYVLNPFCWHLFLTLSQ